MISDKVKKDLHDLTKFSGKQLVSPYRELDNAVAVRALETKRVNKKMKRGNVMEGKNGF